jgi:hypothetical protein
MNTPNADTTPAAAVDTKVFAIGVLTITACVLLVGFLMLAATPPALASRMMDRGGDYILCTQSISNSREALVVIDAAARRVVLYAYNASRHEIEPLDRFALNESAARAYNPQAVPPPPRKP